MLGPSMYYCVVFGSLQDLVLEAFYCLVNFVGLVDFWDSGQSPVEVLLEFCPVGFLFVSGAVQFLSGAYFYQNRVVVGGALI